MDQSPPLKPIDAAGAQPPQTVEVRARIPMHLRDQLEELASRSFRSMAGEVAAACSSWVAHRDRPEKGSDS